MKKKKNIDNSVLIHTARIHNRDRGNIYQPIQYNKINIYIYIYIYIYLFIYLYKGHYLLNKSRVIREVEICGIIIALEQTYNMITYTSKEKRLSFCFLKLL